MNLNLNWVVLIILGIILGYLLRILIISQKKESSERQIQELIIKAETEAKEIIINAKEEAAKILEDISREEKNRKQELKKFEERLIKKEDLLEETKLRYEKEIEKINKEKEELEELKKDLNKKREDVILELEKIAQLTKEEARKKIFEEIKENHKQELLQILIKHEKEIQEKLNEKTLDLITSVIQRYTRNYISDITTTAINLPSEELKGKIIGREGRNIRTFERLTGIELIIDESPETILISAFDPLRREIAKLALEKLIKDGRIQPAKIEEKVEEAQREIEQKIQKIGEEAIYEVGILDLPKELIYTLGKLHFRTSYGQNVLQHSIEVTHFAGMLAAELNLRVDIAKKAALLHDIGKAINHEVEGSHVEIGRRLLKKYNIEEDIIKAMEAHHDEYPYSIPEAFIVAAADAISAARPGARRDTLEKYLKRLEELEKIAISFKGVQQAYAVSAGREVRVFVKPEKIDDFGALMLAKEISNKIKENLNYPGEIKVTVIREVRAVEYAR